MNKNKSGMQYLKKIFKKILYNLNLSPKVKSITILTYHGVVDTIINARLQRNFHTVSQFEEHISFLRKRKYRFLNASELVNFINNPEKIKSQKLVCITFDDGYQNNLKAIEILKKNEVPGTFFISSNVINTNMSIWTVNLSLLLLEGSLEKVNCKNVEYSLSTYQDRLDSFNSIRNYLKSIEAGLRNLLFNDILNQFPKFELEKLILAHDYFKMLTWDEIRNVQDENIQFHSHGHGHEIHHQNQDIEVLKNEIMHSKKIIEENIFSNVFLFAYPNGNYNELAFNFLKESDYKCALQLNEKKHEGSDHRFAVSRISPKGNLLKFKNQI